MTVHRSSAPASAPATPWHALALLCAAQFMVVLDVTVSNVALPSIAADLHVARADLQWVITAYVLGAGGLLLLGGRAADLLGRRRMFATGLVAFTAASLASGLAASAGTLIAARAVQGVGAAMLTPAALSLLVTTYRGAQRTTALTTWGAIGSGGAAAGMLVGGALTTWLGWESVYLVNVPVGLTALALTPRVLAASPASAKPWQRLDLPGAGALVSGLGVLVYAVQGAAGHGWGSARTLGLLAIAAALLAAFAVIERRAAHPIVPPSTWRSATLTGGAGVMLVATGVLVGTFFLSSLYLQGVAGASALETGLAFLPIALAIGAGAHGAGALLGRFGARVVVAAGLVLVAAAALLLSRAPADPSYAADLLPGFLALGLGVGVVFPGASVTAMSEVGHDSAGVASGAMSTAHEIGAALGVAVLGTVAASATGGAVGGFHDGLVVAALAAGMLAAVVTLRLPAVRPAPGAAMSAH